MFSSPRLNAEFSPVSNHPRQPTEPKLIVNRQHRGIARIIVRSYGFEPIGDRPSHGVRLQSLGYAASSMFSPNRRQPLEQLSLNLGAVESSESGNLPFENRHPRTF